VKLRELPGTLILGLLASLLAHAASFGGDHAVGGPFHEALSSLALAGGLGFALLLGLAAWSKTARLAQGSVLAARLGPLVPSAASVTAFATPAFFAIEALEGRHAPVIIGVVLVALAISSFVVAKLAQLFVRAIAHLVVAIASHAFAPRLPYFIRRASARPRICSTRFTYRRFARPPPRMMLPASP
jgi:hypothetical protein